MIKNDYSMKQAAAVKGSQRANGLKSSALSTYGDVIICLLLTSMNSIATYVLSPA